MNPDWLGYPAAILITASYVPQLLKVARTHDTQALSKRMYVLIISGLICWLGYGLILDEWPIIIANGLSLIMSIYIMIMKCKYG